MQRIILTGLFGLLAAHSLSVYAQASISGPWIRATVPLQQSAGAYLEIATRQDMRLVKAFSPLATAIEIHEMTLENNIMKMRHLKVLELPGGKTTVLKPGGTHLMLLGIKRQLKTGDAVPVTLLFENKNKKTQAIEITIPVRPLNSSHSPGNQPLAK